MKSLHWLAKQRSHIRTAAQAIDRAPRIGRDFHRTAVHHPETTAMQLRNIMRELLQHNAPKGAA